MKLSKDIQTIISVTALIGGIAFLFGLLYLLASNGLGLFEFLTWLIVAIFFSVFSILSIKDKDEKAERELIAKIDEKYC
jgi:uncharacterized membrane protein YphA (DoxX/SURF4 family)